VAHEFVGESKSFGVEHPVVGDHERVLEGRAQRIAGAPQPGDIAHEAERCGPRHFLAERLGRQVQGDVLAADQGVVEGDLDFEAEAARIGRNSPKQSPRATRTGLRIWM
jgi:hypothetical protein